MTILTARVEGDLRTFRLRLSVMRHKWIKLSLRPIKGSTRSASRGSVLDVGGLPVLAEPEVEADEELTAVGGQAVDGPGEAGAEGAAVIDIAGTQAGADGQPPFEHRGPVGRPLEGDAGTRQGGTRSGAGDGRRAGGVCKSIEGGLHVNARFDNVVAAVSNRHARALEG
jgi:hypothetical protein